MVFSHFRPVIVIEVAISPDVVASGLGPSVPGFSSTVLRLSVVIIIKVASLGIGFRGSLSAEPHCCDSLRELAIVAESLSLFGHVAAQVAGFVALVRCFGPLVWQIFQGWLRYFAQGVRLLLKLTMFLFGFARGLRGLSSVFD